MTEQQWLTSVGPQEMLNYLRGKASDRKLRLFACACCRHIWHLMTDVRSRTAIETAELYADGIVTKDELAAARDAAWDAPWDAAWGAVWYATWDATWDAARGVAGVAESKARAALLRDLFGNPWRPVRMKCGRCEGDGQAHGSDRPFEWSPDPDYMKCPVCKGDGKSADLSRWLTWNDRTIPRLAQQMYDSRDFSGMAVLGDALEEAGCDSADILNHCRQTGEHVRGCWVVDVLLGKE